MARPKKVFDTATNTYTENRETGQGGAGIVYLVTDSEGNEFALKCLREASTAKRRRFKNELSFCQQDVHPNIVRVLDSGAFTDGERKLPFYVMRRYPNTLRTLINARIAADSVLPFFDQILSGVEAAHLRGVYHRDLKPENILYDPSEKRLVVADFGIAHFGEDELLTAVETKDQERLANFIYAAPEQKLRGGEVDRRADIFALGLILNEMFTVTVPSGARHPLIAQVAPQYAYLDDITERMIRHSPSERHATIEKIKEELVGRGNEFVALQKLDAVRRAVVPASTPNDPLAGEDVKITEVEYKLGQLIFRLEPPPPPNWMVILNRYCWEPSVFNGFQTLLFESHSDGTISVAATEHSAALHVPSIKAYIDRTNKDYRAKLKSQAAEDYSRRVVALEQQRAQAEEIARVNRRLKDLL
jgi:serine/threonine protein kinase